MSRDVDPSREDDGTGSDEKARERPAAPDSESWDPKTPNESPPESDHRDADGNRPPSPFLVAELARDTSEEEVPVVEKVEEPRSRTCVLL